MRVFLQVTKDTDFSYIPNNHEVEFDITDDYVRIKFPELDRTVEVDRKGFNSLSKF